MATYLYFCKGCSLEQDVTKPMKDSSREEPCIMCGKSLTRIYTAPEVIGASVESPEYNPGLGMVIKNKKHRAEMAKRKGLVEVGNETPKTLEKEAKYNMDKKLEKSWEKIEI